MVESFPQVLENPFFLDYSIPISDRICDEWEDIEKTGAGFYDFAAEYAILPPLNATHVPSRILGLGPLPAYEYDQLTDSDYLCIRDMLYLAAKLRSLAVRGSVKLEELGECRIEPFFVDKNIPRYSEKTGCSPLSYRFAEVKVPLEGDSYIDYLTYASKKIHASAYPSVVSSDGEPPCLCFTVHHYWEGPESDERGCFDPLVGKALQVLAWVHFAEIETVPDTLGIPHMVSRWGINALWLAYCNRLARSRVAFCKACNKPILVTDERGTPREYCGEGCRSWKRRHPGETRGLRTKLKDGR